MQLPHQIASSQKELEQNEIFYKQGNIDRSSVLKSKIRLSDLEIRYSQNENQMQALQQKQIAGAGLDVLSEEPPAVDHPLLTSGLKNLIITPHIAWASQQSRQRLLDQLADNILAFKQGKAENLL